MFESCLGNVWEVFGRYLGGVKEVLKGLREVFVRCLKDFRRCLGGVLEVFGKFW